MNPRCCSQRQRNGSNDNAVTEEKNNPEMENGALSAPAHHGSHQPRVSPEPVKSPESQLRCAVVWHTPDHKLLVWKMNV